MFFGCKSSTFSHSLFVSKSLRVRSPHRRVCSFSLDSALLMSVGFRVWNSRDGETEKNLDRRDYNCVYRKRVDHAEGERKGRERGRGGGGTKIFKYIQNSTYPRRYRCFPPAVWLRLLLFFNFCWFSSFFLLCSCSQRCHHLLSLGLAHFHPPLPLRRVTLASDGVAPQLVITFRFFLVLAFFLSLLSFLFSLTL